ncbi:MAG: hypothetical protein MUE96_02785 [Bacteroidia bacterium]|jgi:hypothetical protein|nr:hypothetical protein [Bacteroidia bacterium]
MEITNIEKFSALLSGKILPEYVFAKQFKHHYMFTDLLLNNFSQEKYVFELFNELVIKSNKKGFFIAKPDYYNHSILSEVEISILEYSKLKKVLNGSLNNTKINYLAPTNIPTIIYDESFDWCLYYAYEVEMIIIGSNISINISDDLYETCVLESIDEYLRYIGGDNPPQNPFYNRLLDTYNNLI